MVRRNALCGGAIAINNQSRKEGDSMSKNPQAKPAGKASDAARREFLHKAAKVGIATPAAVTLMLAAENKRARAGCVNGSPIVCNAV